MKKSRWFAGALAFILLLGIVTAVSAFSYQIKWGDTLNRIASQFNVSVSSIIQANSISNPNLIIAGQTLEIPSDDTPPVTSTPVPPPPTNPTPPPNNGTYIVQSGDTLSSIARRFGTTVAAIAQANGISNINFIQVGQQLIIPGGTTTPSPPPPPADNSFAFGGQSVNLTNADRIKSIGMNWIKIQYKWEAGDDAQILADQINAAHDSDLKILLSITGKTAYPTVGSIQFDQYVAFVREVAKLNPNAIEIWNEMNIDFEWPAGEIDPKTYVDRMLAPAYHAIKAENSDVIVIIGALAPTGFDDTVHAWADDRYLVGLRNTGAANYADCVGLHHNAGATSPLVQSGHPGGLHYSWYFQSMLNLYRNVFNGTLPICITELGYLSGEGLGNVPPAFGWAAETTLQNHADWLAEAAQIARDRQDVEMMIVYNVDFSKFEEGDPQAGYAMIRGNGRCPACDTIQQVMSP